jgi:hypothetical protein
MDYGSTLGSGLPLTLILNSIIITNTLKVPHTRLVGDLQARFYETAQAGNIEHGLGYRLSSEYSFGGD